MTFYEKHYTTKLVNLDYFKMKFLHFFSFFFLICSALFPAEILPFYEQIGDFSGKLIVTSQMKENIDSVGKDEDTVSASMVFDEIFKSLNKENVVINLQNTGISDESLKEFYQSLLKNKDGIKTEKIIIDLSGNAITPDSSIVLIELLKNPKIIYVVLSGNIKCSGKNIKFLCASFYNALFNQLEKSDSAESIVKSKIREITNKIIFIKDYYLQKASNEKYVFIYCDLVKKGYLSTDWAEKHKTYYRIISKKSDHIFEDAGFFSDTDKTFRATDLS